MSPAFDDRRRRAMFEDMEARKNELVLVKERLLRAHSDLTALTEKERTKAVAWDAKRFGLANRTSTPSVALKQLIKERELAQIELSPGLSLTVLKKYETPLKWAKTQGNFGKLTPEAEVMFSIADQIHKTGEAKITPSEISNATRKLLELGIIKQSEKTGSNQITVHPVVTKEKNFWEWLALIRNACKKQGIDVSRFKEYGAEHAK